MHHIILEKSTGENTRKTVLPRSVQALGKHSQEGTLGGQAGGFGQIPAGSDQAGRHDAGPVHGRKHHRAGLHGDWKALHRGGTYRPKMRPSPSSESAKLWKR